MPMHTPRPEYLGWAWRRSGIERIWGRATVLGRAGAPACRLLHEIREPDTKFAPLGVGTLDGPARRLREAVRRQRIEDDRARIIGRVPCLAYGRLDIPH